MGGRPCGAGWSGPGFQKAKAVRGGALWREVGAPRAQVTEDPARRTGRRQEEGAEAAVGSGGCKEQPGPSPRRPPPCHVPPPCTPLLKVQRPHQLPSYGLRRGDHRGGRHWGRAAQPGMQRSPLPRHPSAHPPPTESRLILAQQVWTHGTKPPHPEKQGKTLGHWGPLHSSRVCWTLVDKPRQTGSCLPGAHGHISSAPRRLGEVG